MASREDNQAGSTPPKGSGPEGGSSAEPNSTAGGEPTALSKSETALLLEQDKRIRDAKTLADAEGRSSEAPQGTVNPDG